jgi:hypothetical protein
MCKFPGLFAQNRLTHDSPFFNTPRVELKSFATANQIFLKCIAYAGGSHPTKVKVG